MENKYINGEKTWQEEVKKSLQHIILATHKLF